jgi:hypothetical protein
MRRVVATLVGAAVMVPAVAWACGGGGDSGGGDSGSSGGGDSSSSSSDSGYSSSSSESTPACVDTTDVHGYRECTDFGAWRARRSAVAIEIGLVASAVDISGLTASGAIDHDGSMYTYRVVGEDLGGRVAAQGLALRTLLHGRTWYGGFESSFARLSAEERVETMEPRTTLTTRALGSSTALVVVGNRLWLDRTFDRAFSPVSLAAEVAGGVRLTSIEAESETGVCITTDRTIHGSPVVEARLRADWWISPSASLGAWSGTDLIARTPSIGLMYSSHLRAFDGTR